MREPTSTKLVQLREARLTDAQAKCLALYYFDGLRQCQIAKELHITQPTVNEHITLGREKLKAAGLSMRRLEADYGILSMPNREIGELGPEQIKATW